MDAGRCIAISLSVDSFILTPPGKFKREREVLSVLWCQLQEALNWITHFGQWNVRKKRTTAKSPKFQFAEAAAIMLAEMY